jgi:hypothetical protein
MSLKKAKKCHKPGQSSQAEKSEENVGSSEKRKCRYTARENWRVDLINKDRLLSVFSIFYLCVICNKKSYGYRYRYFRDEISK